MKYPIYLYIALKHPRMPGRTPSPVNGLSAADPVRTQPWCLCKPAGEWRGVGLQTTAVTRCAAARQAPAMDPYTRWRTIQHRLVWN